MGDGYAVIGRHRDGAGDAGHHLEGNVMFCQQFQLFAAPPEEEGVAALETHYLPALLGFLQQHAVGFLLPEVVVPRSLARENELRALRDEVQDTGANQCVVDHNIGLGEDLLALEGEQPCIAGASAHQPDLARHVSASFPNSLRSLHARAFPRSSALSVSPADSPVVQQPLFSS